MNKPEALLKKFIVGVTGGIGSGKTAVTDLFVKFGIDVIDADIVAREIVAVASPTLNRIEDHFGNEILLSNGELNRPKLREIIFKDPDEKQWLNDLMHPAIRQEIIRQLAEAKSNYVILAAPLLFENKLQFMVDRVLTIDVPENIQIQRACQRDSVSTEQIEAIIKSQVERQFRLDNSDDIIDNSGSLAQLQVQVEDKHLSYLKMVS